MTDKHAKGGEPATNKKNDSVDKGAHSKPGDKAGSSSQSKPSKRKNEKESRWKRVHMSDDAISSDSDDDKPLNWKAQLLKTEAELQLSRKELSQAKTTVQATQETMNQYRQEFEKQVAELRKQVLEKAEQPTSAQLPVQTPAVNMAAVQMPAAQMPAAQMPPFQMPAFQMPAMRPTDLVVPSPSLQQMERANLPSSLALSEPGPGASIEEVNLWRQKYDEEKVTTSAPNPHPLISLMRWVSVLQVKNALLKAQQQAAEKHEAEQKEWHTKLLESQVRQKARKYLSVVCSAKACMYVRAQTKAAQFEGMEKARTNLLNEQLMMSSMQRGMSTGTSTLPMTMGSTLRSPQASWQPQVTVEACTKCYHPSVSEWLCAPFPVRCMAKLLKRPTSMLDDHSRLAYNSS